MDNGLYKLGGKEYIRMRQAADYLKLKPKGVLDLVREGEIIPDLVIAGRFYFKADTIRSYWKQFDVVEDKKDEQR